MYTRNEETTQRRTTEAKGYVEWVFSKYTRDNQIIKELESLRVYFSSFGDQEGIEVIEDAMARVLPEQPENKALIDWCRSHIEYENPATVWHKEDHLAWGRSKAYSEACYRLRYNHRAYATRLLAEPLVYTETGLQRSPYDGWKEEGYIQGLQLILKHLMEEQAA